MRALLGAAALLAATSLAQADEPRDVPAAGTTLTFRLISTSKLANGTAITVGQVFSYVVTASDGTTAEGTIRLGSLIYGCPEGDPRKECVALAKTPNAKREGDLVTVPVTAEVADSLAKQSSFKYRYFVLEHRTMAFPGPKNPDAPETAEPGLDPAFVMTNSIECDAAALRALVPLGKTPKAAIPCTIGVTRTPGPGFKIPPFSSSEPITMELADGGTAQATLPSGKWEVRKLSFKLAPKDAKNPGVDADIQFSPKLGISVTTHTISKSPPPGAVTETDTELIAVSP